MFCQVSSCKLTGLKKKKNNNLVVHVQYDILLPTYVLLPYINRKPRPLLHLCPSRPHPLISIYI